MYAIIFSVIELGLCIVQRQNCHCPFCPVPANSETTVALRVIAAFLSFPIFSAASRNLEQLTQSSCYSVLIRLSLCLFAHSICCNSCCSLHSPFFFFCFVCFAEMHLSWL